MTTELLGTLFDGKYRIDSILGKGAMGVVYRAAQLDVQGRQVRDVALKMIRPELLALGEEVAERFLREVRAAARLRGSHTIPVYEFGRAAAGRLYYVMELVDGPTLKDVIAHYAPLAPERAVEIGSQICEALHEAHTLSEPVVHRDLKPANIFVERWPLATRVRVGDFGLAKIVGEETLIESGPECSIGTPRYMAPEQFTGGAVDGRTDIYALGVILYEMLAKRPPFADDQPAALMYRHVHERPSPLPESVPEPLRRLVEQLLAKRPEDRPSSAARVRHDLDETWRIVRDGASGSNSRAAARGASASSRLRVGLGAGVALVLLTGLALLLDAADLRKLADRFSEPRRSAPIESAQVSPSKQVTNAVGGKRGEGRRPAARRPGVAVMEFRNERGNDPDHDWMRTALQTTFCTELGKIHELRVLSPEFVGESVTPVAGRLKGARKLGADKVISGSFTVLGGRMRVDARLVDVGSGDQEKAETVEGAEEEFFSLQKRLALALLDRLPVEVSASEREAISAENPSENQGRAVEAFRLMWQGEGLGDREEEEPAGPENAGADVHGALRLRQWGPRLFVWVRDHNVLSASPARAEEHGSAEEEIRRSLEQYRLALEKGDLDGIRRSRGTLSERQHKGLEEYFTVAENLKVEFDQIEIRRVDEKQFVVSYTRRDQFSDRRTGERIDLEVRLENIALRDGEQWWITNRKPKVGE